MNLAVIRKMSPGAKAPAAQPAAHPALLSAACLCVSRPLSHPGPVLPPVGSGQLRASSAAPEAGVVVDTRLPLSWGCGGYSAAPEAGVMVDVAGGGLGRKSGHRGSLVYSAEESPHRGGSRWDLPETRMGDTWETPRKRPGQSGGLLCTLVAPGHRWNS